jgi:hypothetical protein
VPRRSPRARRVPRPGTGPGALRPDPGGLRRLSGQFRGVSTQAGPAVRGGREGFRGGQREARHLRAESGCPLRRGGWPARRVGPSPAQARCGWRVGLRDGGRTLHPPGGARWGEAGLADGVPGCGKRLYSDCVPPLPCLDGRAMTHVTPSHGAAAASKDTLAGPGPSSWVRALLDGQLTYSKRVQSNGSGRPSRRAASPWRPRPGLPAARVEPFAPTTPAGGRVATLKRFQTLMPAIASTRPASAV